MENILLKKNNKIHIFNNFYYILKMANVGMDIVVLWEL